MYEVIDTKKVRKILIEGGLPESQAEQTILAIIRQRKNYDEIGVKEETILDFVAEAVISKGLGRKLKRQGGYKI